jgi:hypothetical protein
MVSSVPTLTLFNSRLAQIIELNLRYMVIVYGQRKLKY